MFYKIVNKAQGFARGLAASLKAPSSAQIQGALFIFGVTLLSVGLTIDASAQLGNNAVYNDTRIAEAVDIIMMHLQGSFGALVIVVTGLLAIISSALGNYKAALGLLVVALGAFILRSLVSTFFNDENLTVNDIRG